jgi:hypothetical protein
VVERTHVCPMCEGDGTDPHCVCDRTGLVDAATAARWAADVGTPVVPVPPPPAALAGPCHDCAFRAGSPEQGSPAIWRRLRASVEDGAPFHCHQGMHCTADGRYIPRRTDAAGAPVGHPVCAGWAAARARWEATAELPAGETWESDRAASVWERHDV